MASATDPSKDQEIQDKINAAIGKEPDIMYLPQVFKEAGYITGQVGKLDYGFVTTAKQMNNHGWDYHYGYYDHTQCHGFYPMFLHENGMRFSIPGIHIQMLPRLVNGDLMSTKKKLDGI